jgi:hypothetical protein
MARPYSHVRATTRFWIRILGSKSLAGWQIWPAEKGDRFAKMLPAGGEIRGRAPAALPGSSSGEKLVDLAE